MLSIFTNHVWVVRTFSFLAGSPPTAIYVIETCSLSKRTLAGLACSPYWPTMFAAASRVVQLVWDAQTTCCDIGK